MFKTYNLLNIGFPVYLVVFEIILRSLSSVNTSSFIGPALAASGLGLLIGVIKPKKVALDPNTEKALKEQGITFVARDQRDEKIVVLGWVAILLELMSWYWSCAMSIKYGDSEGPKSFLPLYIGIGNYILGILLSSLKEN